MADVVRELRSRIATPQNCYISWRTVSLENDMPPADAKAQLLSLLLDLLGQRASSTETTGDDLVDTLSAGDVAMDLDDMENMDGTENMEGGKKAGDEIGLAWARDVFVTVVGAGAGAEGQIIYASEDLPLTDVPLANVKAARNASPVTTTDLSNLSWIGERLQRKIDDRQKENDRKEEEENEEEEVHESQRVVWDPRTFHIESVTRLATPLEPSATQKAGDHRRLDPMVLSVELSAMSREENRFVAQAHEEAARRDALYVPPFHAKIIGKLEIRYPPSSISQPLITHKIGAEKKQAGGGERLRTPVQAESPAPAKKMCSASPSPGPPSVVAPPPTAPSLFTLFAKAKKPSIQTANSAGAAATAATHPLPQSSAHSLTHPDTHSASMESTVVGGASEHERGGVGKEGESTDPLNEAEDAERKVPQAKKRKQNSKCKTEAVSRGRSKASATETSKSMGDWTAASSLVKSPEARGETAGLANEDTPTTQTKATHADATHRNISHTGAAQDMSPQAQSGKENVFHAFPQGKAEEPVPEKEGQGLACPSGFALFGEDESFSPQSRSPQRSEDEAETEGKPLAADLERHLLVDDATSQTLARAARKRQAHMRSLQKDAHLPRPETEVVLKIAIAEKEDAFEFTSTTETISRPLATPKAVPAAALPAVAASKKGVSKITAFFKKT